MFKRNPILIVHLNSDTGIPPIPVFDKRFAIGRKPTHLVSIPDNSVSRDHAEVIFQDGQVFIMDMGTANGTTIEGQRIPNNIPTPYHQGKLINLGKSNVYLTIEIFEEDREKRKHNPSLKAIQQFNISHHVSQPGQEQTKVAFLEPVASSANDEAHHNTSSYHITAHAPAPATSTTLPLSPLSAHGSIPSHSSSASSTALKVEPLVMVPNSDPQFSVQTREDANRILAKAKIEAEIAAKDLLKNKEGEAQKLIVLAESKANDKVKEAESRGQIILQQAHAEAQKLKDEKLEEAKKDKERLLAQVQTEKENILKDIDLLKQTIPSLTQQIDQLKIQAQRFQAEKVAAETQQTHETIRLEKIQSEVKHQELHLQSLNQLLENHQRKIQEAEEKHKQIVLSNHSLIEDTKMALEKARAREQELQSLVEKAKKDRESAVQYATEQRADADSYAKVMKEEADLYAKTEREKTELWIQQNRESTDLEIKNKTELFNKDHEQMVNDRDRAFQEERAKQEQILEELRATEAMKLKNLQDIDAILKQKNDDFDSSFNIKSSQLESEFHTRKNYIEAELRSARESIERELTERRTNIERELLERREILERESVETKVLIENEAQELRTLRDKEYKELKMQQDAYLIDIKKREEERLKSMIEDSRKMIREQFEQKKENVQKALNEFFAGYGSMASPSIKEHLPELHQQLNGVLKEALISENFGEDKQLKQLFEYDPNIEKKHKKFWMRIAIAGAIVLSFLGYLLYNPKSISNSADSITEMVNDIDQETKKVHIERMAQMKKASIYSPTKDNNFKASYTDNILYTNQYLEFEHDDEYRSQWIVSTKEFLIQEAKLIDDKADELLSKEGTLIIALSGENIDGLRPEKGISRMNETEGEFNKFLAQNLKPETIKLLKEKKQAFYERYINDPSKARAPATTNK